MMAKVAVLLAPGFEEVEAIAPIDILRRGGVEVLIVGVKDKVIPSARNVKIEVDLTIDELNDVDNLDMIIIPGGMTGVENLKKSEEVKNLINQMNAKKKYVSAICAGPLVLKNAGVVENKHITSHPSVKLEFNEHLYKEESVVEDENIISSRGPATAMVFGFRLLEKLTSKEKAKEVAKAMLFDY
ncbi:MULTISPECIES: DJ-1 family glyoxalase III [unclassified Hydrogenobaculum]|uniref:DJ-1 family glyoxalase III n=2 Tax=unclassified Hydrogenobaculum TaxID=2622382 RepID=UPI001ED9313C|nr:MULTISPECIES: DJ-1 family glyoxalase III [unclassified Hydrogenobaculum]